MMFFYSALDFTLLQIAIVCARRMTVNILWFLRRVLLPVICQEGIYG
ncbi:Uncharacterised protein [Escherichia coli]|nr:Uncharacterised protein [Escherichia coli]